MNSSVDTLRPSVLSRIAELDQEEDLQVVLQVLLTLEKERLWRELSNEFAADAEAGKYQQIDLLISQARAALAAR